MNLIQPQVEIRKNIAIVIYRLAHGTSDTRISSMWEHQPEKICGYNVMPYVIETICLTNILVFHLVIVYKKIIDCFHDLTCLPNICGAIYVYTWYSHTISITP